MERICGFVLDPGLEHVFLLVLFFILRKRRRSLHDTILMTALAFKPVINFMIKAKFQQKTVRYFLIWNGILFNIINLI